MPEKVHIIGIGDDGLAALTDATRQLLASAEVLIGSDATLRLVPDSRAERLVVHDNFDGAVEKIAASPRKRVVVLATGDPLFYGVARHLCSRLGKERFEVAPGNVLDSYLHIQGGRGVNAVLVEMAGATQELAHDIAVHIGFARPRYLAREDVPADVVDKERATLETLSRNEGKPEAALPKIVEGRLNGFFRDVCLVEQPYAKDDKQSIKQIIGSATIVRYAQVEIG